MWENEEKCILSFIKQLYTKNSEYTQIIFDQQYLSFEELFYSDNLRFEDSVRLHNFQFSGNEIELAQELNIKKETTLNSPQEDFTEHFHRPYISISRSNFTIERVYSRKKIVGTKSKKDNEKVLKELAEKILPSGFEYNRKQGFSAPLGEWMKEDSYNNFFKEVLLDPGSIFNTSKSESLFKSMKFGGSNSERIFSLVIFELWAKEYNARLR